MNALARIASIAATLLILSMIIFGLQQLLPGDPAFVLAGEDKSPETIAAIRARYRLDQPIVLQYLTWLGGVLRGDLGQSMRLNMSAADLLRQKLPVTLQLAAMAFLIAIVIGMSAGIVAALKPNSMVDHVASVVGLIGLSIPSFWLGILMIMLVSVQLGWLPASGYVSPFEDPLGNLKTMIMPAFVLGTGIAAVLMRHTRSAMLEVLSSDYVRTARAKGMPERKIVLKHALRNALIPVVTLGALEFGRLLGGSVLTEFVFTVPGIGKLIVDSVFNRDYAIVQAVVLCSATIYILLNLIADLAYLWLDPRLRGEDAS
ncbi:MAG: ABC transporter permease [Alphaproteobacteria bacterium]|nr:ABC transporter permease [Alphaproteobacteria bacterium]